MLVSYIRKMDQYTTYWLQSDDPNVIELGDINKRSFVVMPDNYMLPPQPKSVSSTLKDHVLTQKLVARLKRHSPILKLTAHRMAGKRKRVLYSAEDGSRLALLEGFFRDKLLAAHIKKWRKRRRNTLEILTKETPKDLKQSVK